MVLIADSSSTRTEWAIVNGADVEQYAVTSGLNPFFRTRREISHIVRLELPDIFFHTKIERVYFYGAGCSSPEKKKVVESSLVAQFRTPVEIESDLLGAARGLLGRKEGLACILSTGANSCMYDGEKVVKNVRPGGYVLGDEGSNAYLGKVLLSDIIKDLAPQAVKKAFFEAYDVTVDDIMDAVYTRPNPNLELSNYAEFLRDNISMAYCRDLVFNAFMLFFERNIAQYDYRSFPLSAVGRTCTMFKATFESAAEAFGIKLKKIEKSSLGGLVKYHAR